MERITQQKIAIVAVLESAESPLTPPEILSRAAKAVPRLGVATVYRALRALRKERKIVIVEIPGEPPRYETATRGHHHHFFCNGCRKVFEIPDCAAKWAELAPPNFQVLDHEIILYGKCPNCQGER
ncbi:Fur family transcriptional regulator [Verrucomicrobium sp. 3C]|uniref:Fur family transcriptional regulator n=1 Tax=Verrucomicrobium sp. 3C TaxID=1134055 RepID=UPI00036D66CE|nr:transcriptional repressor [Verrucomicrobium sp. 3C]